MNDINENQVELLDDSSVIFPPDDTVESLVDHLIAHGVTIRQWISVEERLPTEDDGDAVGAVLAIHKAAKKKYWHWGNVAENPYDFTCWMPLPEPPKGE